MALSIEEIKLMIPQLLRQARKVDEGPEYETGPATLDDIRKFETENDMSLSQDVIEWLMTTNGILCTPDGLNGVSGYMARATEAALTAHPEWKSMNWFPLAQDGCGNYYVSYPIDRFPDRRPVCFVDGSDPDRIAYVVASSAWHFVYGLLNQEMADAREPGRLIQEVADWWESRLLNKEIGDEEWPFKRWPFNRDCVLEQDPTIQEFTELPMPWAA